MNGIFSLNAIILSNVFIWTSFVIFCIAATVIVTLILYKFSNKPEEYDHASNLKEKQIPGLMRDLSTNLRDEKKLKKYRSSIKNTIIVMFLQKIQDKEKLSKEKLIEMKNNNPQEFYQMIGDKDINNFIQNFDENKINKEKYLKEINMILDKMEAWE